VHQIVADADLDELDAALGELRAAGWPAPEDPDSDEDTDLDDRDRLGHLAVIGHLGKGAASWSAHLTSVV
jgi:hypothetical protein